MGGHNDLPLTGSSGSLRRGRGEVLRVAVPLHEGVDLGVQVRQGGDAQVGVELLGEAHEHVAVGQGGRGARLAEGAQAAFPVDVGAVLLDRGGDRQDDVRAISDLRGANLERHEERNLIESVAHGGQRVEVTDVDTADDQGLQLAGCGFLDHLLGVEASLGQLAPSQGLCPGLVNAAAEGKQTREEASLDGGAVAGAARDPREASTRALGESNDGRQKARRLRSALAHEDDAAGQRLSHVGVGTARLNRVHDARLSAGGGVQEASIHLARAVGGEGRNRGDLEARLAHGLAQAQEHGTALVLGFEGNQQHLPSALQIGVRDIEAGARHEGGQEGTLFLAGRTRTEVDRVGADDGTSKLRPGPGVLEREATAGQEANGRTRRLQALADAVERVGPGGGNQLAILAHERVGQAINLVPLEGKAVLVGDPLFVDLRVVAAHATHDLAAAHVLADRAARRVVLRDRGRGNQVEGARAEAVGRGGQGTDRADLDDVTREVGREGTTRHVALGDGQLALVERPNDRVRAERGRQGRGRGILGQRVEEVERGRIEAADLLAHEVVVVRGGGAAASALQVHEHVARNLLAETHAALAQDAALAIQQDLRGQAQRLLEGPLGVRETGLAATLRERLVLQGALATLITDRAVQRVVDEQELHDATLGAIHHLGGVLGLDDHARGDGLRTRGLGLGHEAQLTRVAVGHADLDQALAARGHGSQQRVVTETRDPDAGLLGRADHERALGDRNLNVVDGDVDHVGCVAHRPPPRA